MIPRKRIPQKQKYKLSQLSGRVGELKTRARKIQVDADTRYKTGMRDARLRLNRFRSRIAGIKAGGEDSWMYLKDGAGNAWLDLRKALEKVRSRFR